MKYLIILQILTTTVPHTLWVGRVIDICEGERIVGTATVEKVLNPILEK